MAFTKRTLIDQILIDDWAVVLYRVARLTFEDDVQIGERYVRSTVEPGDDTTGLPQPVRAICNLLHTQPVVDAWLAEKARRTVVI